MLRRPALSMKPSRSRSAKLGHPTCRGSSRDRGASIFVPPQPAACPSTMSPPRAAPPAKLSSRWRPRWWSRRRGGTATEAAPPSEPGIVVSGDSGMSAAAPPPPQVDHYVARAPPTSPWVDSSDLGSVGSGGSGSSLAPTPPPWLPTSELGNVAIGVSGASTPPPPLPSSTARDSGTDWDEARSSYPPPPARWSDTTAFQPLCSPNVYPVYPVRVLPPRLASSEPGNDMLASGVQSARTPAAISQPPPRLSPVGLGETSGGDGHGKGAAKSSDRCQCLACGETFRTMGGLKQHAQFAHDKEEDHQCPHCDASFTIRDINRHQNEFHGPESSSSRNDLNQHLATHRGPASADRDRSLTVLSSSSSGSAAMMSPRVTSPQSSSAQEVCDLRSVPTASPVRSIEAAAIQAQEFLVGTKSSSTREGTVEGIGKSKSLPDLAPSPPAVDVGSAKFMPSQYPLTSGSRARETPRTPLTLAPCMSPITLPMPPPSSTPSACKASNRCLSEDSTKPPPSPTPPPPPSPPPPPPPSLTLRSDSNVDNNDLKGVVRKREETIPPRPRLHLRRPPPPKMENSSFKNRRPDDSQSLRRPDADVKERKAVSKLPKSLAPVPAAEFEPWSGDMSVESMSTRDSVFADMSRASISSLAPPRLACVNSWELGKDGVMAIDEASSLLSHLPDTETFEPCSRYMSASSVCTRSSQLAGKAVVDTNDKDPSASVLSQPIAALKNAHTSNPDYWERRLEPAGVFSGGNRRAESCLRDNEDSACGFSPQSSLAAYEFGTVSFSKEEEREDVRFGYAFGYAQYGKEQAEEHERSEREAGRKPFAENLLAWTMQLTRSSPLFSSATFARHCAILAVNQGRHKLCLGEEFGECESIPSRTFWRWPCSAKTACACTQNSYHCSLSVPTKIDNVNEERPLEARQPQLSKLEIQKSRPGNVLRRSPINHSLRSFADWQPCRCFETEGDISIEHPESSSVVYCFDFGLVKALQRKKDKVETRSTSSQCELDGNGEFRWQLASPVALTSSYEFHSLSRIFRRHADVRTACKLYKRTISSFSHTTAEMVVFAEAEPFVLSNLPRVRVLEAHLRRCYETLWCELSVLSVPPRAWCCFVSLWHRRDSMVVGCSASDSTPARNSSECGPPFLCLSGGTFQWNSAGSSSGGGNSYGAGQPLLPSPSASGASPQASYGNSTHPALIIGRLQHFKAKEEAKRARRQSKNTLQKRAKWERIRKDPILLKQWRENDAARKKEARRKRKQARRKPISALPVLEPPDPALSTSDPPSEGMSSSICDPPPIRPGNCGWRAHSALPGPVPATSLDLIPAPPVSSTASANYSAKPMDGDGPGCGNLVATTPPSSSHVLDARPLLDTNGRYSQVISSFEPVHSLVKLPSVVDEPKRHLASTRPHYLDLETIFHGYSNTDFLAADGDPLSPESMVGADPPSAHLNTSVTCLRHALSLSTCLDLIPEPPVSATASADYLKKTMDGDGPGCGNLAATTPSSSHVLDARPLLHTNGRYSQVMSSFKQAHSLVKLPSFVVEPERHLALTQPYCFDLEANFHDFNSTDFLAAVGDPLSLESMLGVDPRSAHVNTSATCFRHALSENLP